jgi:hypothetical protein
MFSLTSTPAQSKILALQCSFSNLGQTFITIYDDGTPARIGVKTGVGNKAKVMIDELSKSIALIEMNVDGFPITLTTINPKMEAVHSRQIIDRVGEIAAPSQGTGKCQKIDL